MLGVTIVIASFLGVKIYDHNKNKKADALSAKWTSRIGGQEPLSNPAAQSQDNDSGDVVVEVVPDQGELMKQLVAKQQQLKKVSFVSSAFFAARFLYKPLFWPGIITYTYAIIPYVKDVEASFRRDKKINVDALFFLANGLTLGLGQYFTSAISLALAYMANVLVFKTQDNSQKVLENIFDQVPKTVWVEQQGVELEVPLEQVKSGDIVIVNTSEVIPVDGTIVEGVSAVDQRSLTGESQPAEKGPGEQVFASTLVLSGKIKVKGAQAGQDTVSSNITQILAKTTNFKSQVQLKGEEWANFATAPMFWASLPALVTVGASATVVFINSHIGYRIKFLAPLATFNHIIEASESGILIKDGRILEQSWKVDTVVFDKTGTLTSDVPEVTKVFAEGSFDQTRILSLAATAECKLSHPIAQAICLKAREQSIETLAVDDANYKIGYGIMVSIDNQQVAVGSLRFMTSQQIDIPDNLVQAQEAAHAVGDSFVFVSVDSAVCGAIELRASVRPEAVAAIAKLKQMGIKRLAILSGDHEGPTKKLAEDLGIDDYYFDVLPEDKAKVIEQYKAQGRFVCFVGDGINDAIAMKTAQISISLSGASSVAQDVAEVLLLNCDLNDIPQLFELSKRLDGELKRRLKLTVAPAAVNFVSIFLFPYSIMTSVVINTGFFFAALGDPNKLVRSKNKPAPQSLPLLADKDEQ